ncbi:dockerin type I domain-containing protein [Ruminococcus sp.]|uniref:dockerin type I domain-containing protein n=1 Tax=Ruminococcus sp. TaxID=41978 RepID=UPI0025F483F8|nr:dockerin type I domain-containing protein [Ruminococcus sp.]MCR4639148.1 hypothetical protein [Ruminococcus sp.]
MNIKNIASAAFSAVFVFAAGFAVFTAGGSPTNIGSNAAAATTVNTSKETKSTTETTVTTEPTTEPTTLKTYYIKFLDFDGNLMKTVEVEEGDPINYNSVDTSSLHKHYGVNTEQAFYAWDINPQFADNDYTIHALSQTATITFKNPPKKYRYFSTKGNVILDGLEVYVKKAVQKPEKDKNGNYIVEENVVDISASCKASPSALSEAFANSDKATITVYPLGDKKSLCQFDIICYRDLGDLNEDGYINAVDASAVLNAYANMAASKNYTVSDKFVKLADVNMDGSVNARDASYILNYYAKTATSNEFMDWENFLDYDKILGTK